MGDWPFWTRVRHKIRDFFRGIRDALSSIPFPSLSAGHLLLLSVAVIVFIVLFDPGGGVVELVLIGAFVLFIVAFALSLRRNAPGGGRPPEKLWRGKPMDLQGPGMGDRLRSWWRRRSRR